VTTSIIELPGATLPSDAISLSDLPFPRTNLLFHASASKVTEEAVVGTTTETRIVSFDDVDTGAAYSVATAARIAKIADVNGLKVADVSLQAGVGTTARNYQVPSDFLSGRNKVVLVGLTKADAAASAVQTLFGAGANANTATTNGSALFDIEHPTPTSIRLRAEAQSNDLTNLDVSATLSGLPAAFIVWRATMDLVAKMLTMEVDKVGAVSVPFPDAVAPSPSFLAMRIGLFRHVAPTPTNTVSGNMFTGRFRRIAGFTGSLSAKQLGLLLSMFRAEAAVLNR